ncbi:MAG: hypothetical protein V2I82_05615 [Halieaceae bacterium]|jgi:uncharacterized protein involved in exopolysaccharide biosynthesis|nr:hypothetical protein [Halieaceae bacterium]
MALMRSSVSAPLAPDFATQESARRRRVFLCVALPLLLAGMLYTALQPAVYESTATVLMSAPTAIDEQMLEADIQGVAIQRRTLTGSEITRAVAERIAGDFGRDIDLLALRRMLKVQPVPETNLLELAATGDERELLPTLVESWIDVYTGVRSRDIQQRKEQTLAEVQGELDGLADRLVAARQALEDYRDEHEIISMERQENAVLSRLDGLNSALNNAVEEEVKARAYLDTLRATLESGEQVVPGSERSEVTAMAQELAALRTRLAELRARYTDDYIRKDPRLREIPEQIEDLEGKLTEAYSAGSRTELANAERAYETARGSVRDLEARLAAHKEEVTAFNTVYATHEALVADLARLEDLNRETQARLVQIEVSRVDRYPQLAVVNGPDPEALRIGPPYLMLLGGTLLVSLLGAIFAVWLYGFLNPRAQQGAYVTLSGVHLYPQDGAEALEQGARAARLQGGASAPRLSDASAEASGDDEGSDEAEENAQGRSA